MRAVARTPVGKLTDLDDVSVDEEFVIDRAFDAHHDRQRHFCGHRDGPLAIGHGGAAGIGDAVLEKLNSLQSGHQRSRLERLEPAHRWLSRPSASRKGFPCAAYPVVRGIQAAIIAKSLHGKSLPVVRSTATPECPGVPRAYPPSGPSARISGGEYPYCWRRQAWAQRMRGPGPVGGRRVPYFSVVTVAFAPIDHDAAGVENMSRNLAGGRRKAAPRTRQQSSRRPASAVAAVIHPVEQPRRLTGCG